MISDTLPAKPFIKGYRFPLYPTPAQAELFEKTAGCCRYIWNRALADAQREYAHYLELKNLGVTTVTPPNHSGFSFANRLPAYKTDPNCSWLADVSSVALQQTMMHLGDTYGTFFKNRKGFPNFKSKHRSRPSFTLMTNAFTIRDRVLRLAKCDEPVAIHWTREMPSIPKSATVTKTPTGRWYISFICEYFPVKTSGTGVVGVDLGLRDFLITSDGVKVGNKRFYEHAQKLLKRRQQTLSRSQKGSLNRNKARLAVAKVHATIANRRNDFQHKLSRTLVNENQVIGMESLVVKDMIKDPCYSKSISDAAWGAFRLKLAYKARESQHCAMIYMDTYYPSTHICSVDYRKLDYKLGKNDESWVCPYCLTEHDRDINAAINIRREALRAFQDVDDGVDRHTVTNARTRY